jgi:fumarylacetoacetase
MEDLRANDPQRKSWVKVEEGSDFPIQNIPFGVAAINGDDPVVVTRIGDWVLKLDVLATEGFFDSTGIPKEAFVSDVLNDVMVGKQEIRALRNQISDLLEEGNEILRDDHELLERCLVKVDRCRMKLPVNIGDYTDFYSSKEHATNVGTMFRDPDNALLPNWLHLPVGYHGRSSSIIVSGTDIQRPKGQQKPDDGPPVYGYTKLLDFELEMAFITFDGKVLGQSISTEEAENYIFGMVVFNDWSARDMQKWEYVPLGPFLAKNFASSISPWIVTLDALDPYRTSGPSQEPKVLEYLQYSGNKNFDIELEVFIEPVSGEENLICQSNFKYLYWNMAQQLAHHTVNGCNIRRGDMMASGTISGPDPKSYGSMLELSWRGTKPLKLNDGTERKFIQDRDTVIMRAHCDNGRVRIGFGEVRTSVLESK